MEMSFKRYLIFDKEITNYRYWSELLRLFMFTYLI